MQKTNPDTHSPLPASLDSLEGELESLRRLLSEHANGCTHRNGLEGKPQVVSSPGNGAADTPICSSPHNALVSITRFFPGLTLEEWGPLAGAYGLQDWLALALDAPSYRNVWHLQQALELLAHQTEHDPLTGLVNRRGFQRKLDIELERVERSKGVVSIVSIDLDDFKRVNDTYGHPCGDTVLCGLAETLMKTKRTYDVAARIGGEEFCLLLPGASPLKAKAMAERVLDSFSAHAFCCGQHSPFWCTFSAGVAGMQGKHPFSPDQLMALADQALYEAKTHGKNCVHIARQQAEKKYDRSTMVHSSEKQFLFSKAE